MADNISIDIGYLRYFLKYLKDQGLASTPEIDIQQSRIDRLETALSAPAVPVIEGLEEALDWYSKIDLNELKQIEHPMYYLLTTARAYAALPKMQKVDLDGMSVDDFGMDFRKGANFVIEFLKFKYGELYAEVK